jgi:MraZ protein
MTLIGTYECKVDAKGRILFPVAFKNQLSELIDKGFVIKRGVFGKCLELHPMPEFMRKSSTFDDVNLFIEENNDFIRKFMDRADIIELDSSGRLLIPKQLIKYGGISKEVVLASVLTKIEIWDKDRYEKAVTYDPNEFARLAEKVMGQIKTEKP